jgi:hypothetical protein
MAGLVPAIHVFSRPSLARYRFSSPLPEGEVGPQVRVRGYALSGAPDPQFVQPPSMICIWPVV